MAPVSTLPDHPSSTPARNFFEELLPLPPAGGGGGQSVCKPCNPSEGLAIGGRPITLEELQLLTPEDLEEHSVTRHGVELTMTEFAELLNVPAEFAEMLDALDEQELPPDGENEAPSLPLDADEGLFLTLASQFR